MVSPTHGVAPPRPYDVSTASLIGKCDKNMPPSRDNHVTETRARPSVKPTGAEKVVHTLMQTYATD